MTGPETRDELVERIARAVHHHAYESGHEWCEWDRLSPFARRHYMTDARVMLDTLHPEAQANARTRLVQMYPSVYAALYEEEKRKVFQNLTDTTKDNQ